MLSLDSRSILMGFVGRADSPITWSKSCSDKLALKQVTGLLSSLTTALIAPERAYLDSLVIPESQYVPEACRRSFAAEGRLKGISDSVWPSGYGFVPFEVKLTSREFAFSRRRCNLEASPKASNKSVLWTPHVQQIVVNGVLQGRKQIDAQGASAIARQTLAKMVQAMTLSAGLEVLKPIADARRYADAKGVELLGARRWVKRIVVKEALQGWTSNAADDFRLDSIEQDEGIETSLEA